MRLNLLHSFKISRFSFLYFQHRIRPITKRQTVANSYQVAQTNLLLGSNFLTVRHVLPELEDARYRSYPEPGRDAAVRKHTDGGGRPGGLHGVG